MQGGKAGKAGAHTGGRRSQRGAGPVLAVALTVLVASTARGVSATAAADPLTEERSGGAAVIDWRRGVIAATGGAAADQRMPSAEAARPAAERRARAAARGRLGEMLRALPLGGGRHLDEAGIARAVESAHAVNVDYQSNGGVVVRMEVAFGAWADRADRRPAVTGSADAGVSAAGTPSRAADAGDAPDSRTAPPDAPLALSLSEARLAAAPLLVVGGQEVAVSSARYVVGGELPAGVKPVAARPDKKGRWLITAAAPDKETRASTTRGDAPGAGPTAEFAGRHVVVYVHKILR